MLFLFRAYCLGTRVQNSWFWVVPSTSTFVGRVPDKTLQVVGMKELGTIKLLKLAELKLLSKA